MKPLTIGSLFSGIGGLDLGIERGLASAGVAAETIWQVEQSDYCRRILSRHWPHAERYTDVRTITASSVHPIDVLVGGFPCQDISTAGKGAGLAGEKSSLFFEMARIIRELRPQLVVMENVPAITSRGLDTVLGTMAALGYDARWGGLRASEVGAPHRRERWFCVCWLADSMRFGHPPIKGVQRESDSRWTSEGSWNSSGAIVADNDRKRGAARARLPAIKRADLSDPDRGDGRGSSMAHSNGTGRQKQQPPAVAARLGHDTRRSAAHRGAGVSQSELGREPDGIPARLDIPRRWPAPPGPQHAWEPPRTRPRQPHDRERLRALGNAVVPACAEIIGRFIASELLDLS